MHPQRRIQGKAVAPDIDSEFFATSGSVDPGFLPPPSLNFAEALEPRFRHRIN